jgi:type IV pilus assembly protein PilY1
LPAECSDLSSVPLSTIKRAAPPNIMFLLDDSGSMDWEFLTTENNGKFQDYEYIFNSGDNVFSGSEYILSGSDRKKWKSQWSGYNKLYYDPSVTYQRWPNLLDDADPENPRSHPMHETPTFDLSAIYYSVAPSEIIVDNTDAGFSMSTGWATGSLSDTYGDNHYYINDDFGGHWAKWMPALPAGTYEVFAWWAARAERRPDVSYTIYHSGVISHPASTYNQQVDGGQWNSLGSFAFSGDDTEYVEINATEPGFYFYCADAVKFVPTSAAIVDIKNAHYYVWSAQEGKPYLIVLDGEIKYYEVTGLTGTDPYQEVTELTLDTTPPDDVIPKKAGGTPRSYTEERQNFANWYSFYRRRELTATAAVAHAIVNMQGVNVGFYSINQSLIQPVLGVKARGSDYTATLLDSLYSLAPVPDT